MAKPHRRQPGMSRRPGPVRPPLARSVAEAVRALPALPGLLTGRRVPWPFAEKVMLVVTGVNRCRYCAYVHTRTALRSGVAPEELQRLLALQPEDGESTETPAFAFARHYAESGGRPDPEAVAHLRAFYGAPMARDLLAAMRLISLANALSNRIDRLIGSVAAGKKRTFPPLGRKPRGGQ